MFFADYSLFHFVGVNQNYFTESSQTVARVDGHDITQQDWDNAHRAESDRLRAENPTLDAKLLDSPEARYATLEKLVRDRVLAAAATKMHLTTSDAQLVRTLREIPRLLRCKSRMAPWMLRRTISGLSGNDPEGFEANLRRELSLNQVLGSVSSTGFATEAQLQQAMDALYQRREIQVARFDAAAFAAKVQPTEAISRPSMTRIPASSRGLKQRRWSMCSDLDAVQQGIVLSEEDLRTYYKENAARLAGPEERRASHILINAAKDLPSAERESQGQGRGLLAQVRKDPKTFAQWLRKILRIRDRRPMAVIWATSGATPWSPFEEAVFKMKEGDISDVVESDFGYHIIELTSNRSPRWLHLKRCVPSWRLISSSSRRSASSQKRQRLFRMQFTSSQKRWLLSPRNSS
ncbi:SurA N-terminal domain-containing protein [Staphylococcus epidermidis]|nr:SurA N-terminal domain-containing protein [Staphylococcus epidermidis]